MHCLCKIKGYRLAEKPGDTESSLVARTFLGPLLVDVSPFVYIYADVSEDKCSRNCKHMVLPRNSLMCENRKRLKNYFRVI